jgi:hypothetical protein
MTQQDSSPSILHSITDPWYEGLKNPAETQRQTLNELLKEYANTRYGQDHHASEIESIENYRKNFPAIDYKAMDPYLAELQKGNYAAFLPEPLICWVMTRGSTGKAKVLPATQTHLEQIFSCGARAFVNHIIRKNNYELLDGHILNLNFPSSVHTITKDGQTMTYGYSSGTYARLNPMLDTVSLLPRQEDIDALGPSIARSNWEKRFELAYQQTRDTNVTATMGVTPIVLSFAKYIKKKYDKKPQDLWKVRALFCTSVRKIPFKYAPVLRKYYGNVPVVEIYSATEGVFAQQLDDLPYVTPNYDKYVFEVETRHSIKMLHELERGEWGRLIVSSCMFPRYDIGDLIEAAGKNYFRVIGRRNTPTLLEHRLYRLFFGWRI